MVAYQYLTEELRCKPESIVLFGRSLGSGPVCRLAQRLQEQGEKVGGLILHSPFISVKEVGVSLLGGVANVISDRWDNRVPCAVVRCRLLIIHGASDEVVPFAHAEALRDARKANGLHCTFFPTQGTHNYFSYYRDYLHPVENFLAQHVARKMPPLPDPLPMARYSRAQVKEIVELRKKRASQAAAREHQSAGGATPRAPAAVRGTTAAAEAAAAAPSPTGASAGTGPRTARSRRAATRAARGPGRRARTTRATSRGSTRATPGEPRGRRSRSGARSEGARWWRRGEARHRTRGGRTTGSSRASRAGRARSGGRANRPRASPRGSDLTRSHLEERFSFGARGSGRGRRATDVFSR